MMDGKTTRELIEYASDRRNVSFAFFTGACQGDPQRD